VTFIATNDLLDKCLTDGDIDFMLQQKIDHSNFKWDNSRLGFNLDNKNYWYAFSIPLFSQDKTKAILTIEDLCRGYYVEVDGLFFSRKKITGGFLKKEINGFTKNGCLQHKHLCYCG
jgi:hypothetical protein